MSGLTSRVVNRLRAAVGLKPIVRFGSLRQVVPISRGFGLDRGRPIDRYYIESFLSQHQEDIRGRVLEAGGLVNYTRQFGGERVTQGDVLYPKAGFPSATIVGDLATGQGIPASAFDCILLTQVFQFIFDVPAAIHNAYRALKPGGILLATVPGISQICRYDMEQWGDYWRFTDASARKLVASVFGEENVSIESHGNVLIACGFLHGLALEDFRADELEANDRDYQVSIAIRAVRTVA